MAPSWWQLLIVLALALLLFGGGGKIPRLMRDMGQGINAFKKGLKTKEGEDGDTAAAAGQKIEADRVGAQTAAQPAAADTRSSEAEKAKT